VLFAVVGSTLYKLLFLGHMLAFAIAFAPAVVAPVLMARAKKDGGEVVGKVGGYLYLNGKQIHLPALVALGAFGMGMVFEGGWGFGSTWVSLAFLVWLAIAGIVTAVIMPAERALGAGELSAEKKVELGGQITTLLVLVILILMIWKPGA
jgi:hypothetical protein